ncbi:hypothetical protein [Inediibacterium massiliense]|uniref:hypothetical protein n=1 Tax=Inediibacterium massiliense TaxID=1658111 RepID=UPI0006B56ECD|nr:hypothetical protein [Inediibacterium massiliense]
MKTRWNVKIIILIGIIFLLSSGIVYRNVLKVYAYPALKKVQQELILFKTKDYKVRETSHFIIRYDLEDESVIDLVAKASEEHYNQVCNAFSYYPKEKTVVIVYEDPEKLMKNSFLKKGEPPMGVYLASTIQILSPKVWVPKDQDIEDTFLNQGPMVHEFTHLIVDDIAKGNYPLWFTEGMALYQEYVQTGYSWGEGISFDGKEYTMEQLTNDFGELDQTLAYKESFEIVKSMAQKDGFERLHDILYALGKGEKIEKYFE